MKFRHIFSVLTLMAVLASCGHPSVPSDAQKVDKLPVITPDYTEVTVPGNICPLNFAVSENSTEAVARLTVGDKSYTYGDGNSIQIDEAEWGELRDAAKGGSIKVEVFAKVDGAWKAYAPFSINVAEDEIDPYISYRLIQPSYVAYEKLSIVQRNITTFDESDIYSNMAVTNEKDGQCINCHSYKNYRTDNMLFHMRQSYGGTMMVCDGQLKKVDLKTDETISAGVYPAWHPTLNLIAFSTNNTGQSFHTRDVQKIEVQDTHSDLILYDVDKNEVSHICNDSTELEVFPCWSADGKTLYYCSAHFEYANDTTKDEVQMIQRYKEVKYSIYSRSFDEKTHKFGPAEMVFDAAALGKSATLPRVSPDGRYLVFSLGNFGCFHVWHPEADIYIIDLKSKGGAELDPSLLAATDATTGATAKADTEEDKNADVDATSGATTKASAQPVRHNGPVSPYKVWALKELNSNLSESYPSFSSNSRWIMCASRRDDGNYTRPYISYIDKNGKCHKAFELPQENPYHYTFLLRSFNRPEFMVEPVKFSSNDFAAKAKTDAVKATFKK